MTFSRIAVAAGIALLTAFVVVVFLAGPYGLGSVVIVLVTMAVLISAGSLLYGRRSHYAAAQARTRPAQEAHDRAADMAADVRRATAEAARRGERFCPLDPAHREAQQPSAGAGTGAATSTGAATRPTSPGA